MTQDAHRRARDAIADHFAGAGVPDAEQEMRAHLPTCSDCHALYERHLLLASLDPAGVPLETRLARGLGIRPARVPRRAFFGWLSLCGAAVAALLLMFNTRGTPGESGPAPRSVTPETPGLAVPSGAGVASRGAPANVAAARAPEVEVYRIFTGRRGSNTSEKADDFVYAGDELAFAYRNPARKRRLLVFAVDEHGHVYWYHPGWSDAGQNPTAVPISAEPGRHELPAAVLHKFDGERIMIHALFTDRELSVRQIEAAVASVERGRSPGAPAPLAIPGAIDVVQPLRVIR
jgi:hypothetical protein